MTTAGRPHDLPPLWDGRHVTWSPWRDVDPGSLAIHAPSDAFACTGCGWITETQMRSIGRLHPEPGATFTIDGTELPAWPVAVLAVRRCTGCGLDQVTDLDTGDVWDLDDTDYGDTGSWADDVPVQDTLF
jgi:hypothetical protein